MQFLCGIDRFGYDVDFEVSGDGWADPIDLT